MKVLILTEGGINIGFGHLTRCFSLYQAFEERGISPQLIVSGQGIDRLLEGKEYLIFDWLREKDKLFDMLGDATVVIVDSYLADHSLYKAISEKVENSVYFDDYKRLIYPRGFVVNGSIYAQEMNYPQREDITYLLGPQFVPLRKEFCDSCRKEIRDTLKSVMLTFGGDDKQHMTSTILRFLNNSYPELAKQVVVGGAFQNLKEIESLKDEKTDLIYDSDAKQMKEIMLKSDVAVSSGGQTLYELASVGMPTVGICVAHNQLGNVRKWEKLGFLEYIGLHNDRALLDRLGSKIEYLKERQLREKKSEIGKRFIDGKGGMRIVDAILPDYFKKNLSLRKAVFEDATDVYNLSNDHIVRIFSFNSQKIDWGHHLKWYREKLTNENCVFLILNIMGRFSGQLRFDLDAKKKEAIVNISLIKELRGLGLSSFVLEKSISELLRMHQSIQTVKAYVQDQNVPSMRLFERTNFTFLKNTIIKDKNAKVYIKTLTSGA